MKRNMLRTVAAIKGKNFIPTHYDMVVGEMQTIYDIFRADPYEAISTTFDYGFVLGARAQKAGKLHLESKYMSKEKSVYIERINHEMLKCSDINTLDLIYKILVSDQNIKKESH